MIYTFALLIVSTAIFIFYISLATQNHFSQLEPMIEGTAPRPYVYRALTPFIVRILSTLLNISPYFGAVLVMYVAMLGFSFAISALAKVFLPSSYAQLFALLAPIGLIPFLWEQRHIYDFPTLFLFTISLYFLAKDDFLKYILAFVLATLSKETSFLLFLFFVLQFRRLEKRKFLLLAFVQVTAYILIRLLLINIYKDNPGGLVEFHLYDHLYAYLTHPVNTLLLFGTMAGILVISLLNSRERSSFVQNSLLAIGGPTLLLYFFFGVPFEVRIFLETYPSIFLVVSQIAIFIVERIGKSKLLKDPG